VRAQGGVGVGCLSVLCAALVLADREEKERKREEKKRKKKKEKRYEKISKLENF
jgi:hypothetical protein